MAKTLQELEREQRDRQRAILAEQSALRVESGRRAEAERAAAAAGQDAEYDRRMAYVRHLKQTDPVAYNNLTQGEQMAAARWAAEQQGRGGRDNRDAGVTFSGFVDPRFPRLAELKKTDAGRYEQEFAKLSSVDKISFGRWLSLQRS